MKIKTPLYVSLMSLIAWFVAVQQSIAQVRCGPTIIPKATLVVNWPQYLYDPTHSGCNPYESILSVSTVGSLMMKWQYQPGEQGFISSPAVANNVVYFGSSPDPSSGILNAVDASTGNLIWAYGLGAPGTSSPSVANGIIYFAGSLGIYAFNPAGTPVWHLPTPQAVTASPVIVNGVLYDRSDDGTLYALNASSGAVIWKYSTANNSVSSANSSPAVAGGVVYVGSSDNNVYALDASTGALIWKYATGDMIYSSPAVASGKVYIGSLDGNVYALDAKTGALGWQYQTGDFVFSSPAVAKGVVYVNSENNIYALNGATGALLWASAIEDTISSAAVANDVVFVAGFSSADGNNLYALDASTGAVLWKSAIDDFPSTPAVANGVVYIDSYCCMTAFHLPGQ